MEYKHSLRWFYQKMIQVVHLFVGFEIWLSESLPTGLVILKFTSLKQNWNKTLFP